jgi:hypothetical protein
MKFLNTNDRFSSGDYPRATRNFYSLFGDGGQDLFRHGLAEITPFPVENNANSDDPSIRNTRLNMFTNTADYSPVDGSLSNLTAKEDPVMFGFDIVIRTEESPLFSHTLSDSIQNFFQSDSVSGNAEILSRIPVWQNFKMHFFQFFRDSLENIPYSQSANEDNPSNSRFYYYLKKVSGLDNLVENNSSDSIKSFTKYGSDKITLEFYEDVTLRVGRMAQLYKTLYWSRLNGKTMIPENLLRFDCDIIISEVRNFARVKKIIKSSGDENEKKLISSNELEILRDNVNRYVYTLYECQLFFDKMPHPDVINLAEPPSDFNGYTIAFNYKYSTLRVDNFNPITNKYVPLNNGTYDPFAITPLDKFLNSEITINGTFSNSTIGDPVSGTQPEIKLYVVPYNEHNTIKNDQNERTNSDIGENAEYTEGTIEQAKKNEKIGTSIADMKNEILNREIESAKAGAPKESWLNSNSPVARLSKRLANTGIAAANQIIASRFGLLNKTLNKILNNVIPNYNSFPAPRNIYEKEFNGQLYLTSKMVRESFRRFAGESISDLFNKK